MSTATIFLTSDGKIVLVKRKNRGWSLPGGEIAWGESIAKNVRRKLREEMGL